MITPGRSAITTRNIAAAYNNRGTAYYETEKYDKAISEYNKAIKLEPHFSAAYYNRGITLSKAGQGRSGSGRFRQSEAARPGAWWREPSDDAQERSLVVPYGFPRGYDI